MYFFTFAKLNFQNNYQSLVSHSPHSYAYFKETFIINNIKTVVLLNIFYGNHITFFQDSLINKKV